MMFYGQCFKCGERWGLGTAPTCVCPDKTTRPEREWVGLTDEEIADLWSAQNFHINDLELAKDFVRDIEAKLKEKNT
jgi:hypothetical protein